jgi:hypothetical protein
MYAIHRSKFRQDFKYGLRSDATVFGLWFGRVCFFKETILIFIFEILEIRTSRQKISILSLLAKIQIKVIT